MRLARSTSTWWMALLGVCLVLCVLLSSRPAQAQTPSALGSKATGEGALTAAAVSAVVAGLVASAPASSAVAPVSSALTPGSQQGDEGDEITMSPHAPPPPAWMAGFCDARGASGIAPLPALPVQGGTLDGDDGCDGPTMRAGRVIERNETPSQSPGADALDIVSLPPTQALPVRAEPRTMLRFDERQLALPQGFARGIEEPPRG